MVKASALQKVAQFKDFNEEHNPHEEHDHGMFDHCNRELFFKIEYYNLTMDADDYADPAKTKRVMTVGFTMNW
jgi:hypothetical protein